jgi:hypothetical protein
MVQHGDTMTNEAREGSEWDVTLYESKLGSYKLLQILEVRSLSGAWSIKYVIAKILWSSSFVLSGALYRYQLVRRIYSCMIVFHFVSLGTVLDRVSVKFRIIFDSVKTVLEYTVGPLCCSSPLLLHVFERKSEYSRCRVCLHKNTGATYHLFFMYMEGMKKFSIRTGTK